MARTLPVLSSFRKTFKLVVEFLFCEVGFDPGHPYVHRFLRMALIPFEPRMAVLQRREDIKAMGARVTSDKAPIGLLTFIDGCVAQLPRTKSPDQELAPDQLEKTVLITLFLIIALTAMRY